MNNLQFEWDPYKEQRNIHNHGIDFHTAALVFYDPRRIDRYDVIHSLIEDRYITLGLVQDANRILYVVYTIRDPDIIRIISARIANRREQEEYYAGS